MASETIDPRIGVWRRARLDQARVPHVVSFSDRGFSLRGREIRAFLAGGEASGFHAVTADRDPGSTALVVHFHLSDETTARTLRERFGADGPAPLPDDHPLRDYA